MMKNLPKMITLALMGALVSNATAQQLSIKTGLNLSKISNFELFDSEDAEKKFKPGNLLGVTIGFPIRETWALETGLIFDQKGASLHFHDYGDPDDLKLTMSLNYLNFPLTVNKYVNVGKNTRLVFTAGSYFGVGLWSGFKLKYRGEAISETASFSDMDLTPIDMGLKASVGVELNKIGFFMGYDHGMINVLNENDPSKYGNRVLNFSIGYKFFDSKNR